MDNKAEPLKGLSHFICAVCHGTFEYAWSDAEAAAESRARFGVDIDQDPTMGVVCDTCYQAILTNGLDPRA